MPSLGHAPDAVGAGAAGPQQSLQLQYAVTTATTMLVIIPEHKSQVSSLPF
jgi:hypothetical protein